MITFMDIVNERMDIHDAQTRKAVLNLESVDKNQIILSLSAKLYTFIKDEITEIDFGKIPDSRGDITKIPNFLDLTQCIETLHELLVAYKQPTDPVDTVAEAIEHLKEDRKMWEKAFVINSDMPIALYNTIALSIVSSVSFLISGSIEFIKDTGEEAFRIELDKVGYIKSKDNLLFKNLAKFNKSCRKKEMQKAVNGLLSAERAVDESGAVVQEDVTVVIAGILGTVSLISVLTLILPIIQELVAFLYCARQNVSDYFSVQSDIVRMNAENVKLDVTKTTSERNKIYKKQIKISDTFKKISNKLSIKLKSSEKQAQKVIADQNSKKYKINDVTPTLPNGVEDVSTSGIF